MFRTREVSCCALLGRNKYFKILRDWFVQKKKARKVQLNKEYDNNKVKKQRLFDRKYNLFKRPSTYKLAFVNTNDSVIQSFILDTVELWTRGGFQLLSEKTNASNLSSLVQNSRKLFHLQWSKCQTYWSWVDTPSASYLSSFSYFITKQLWLATW